MKNHDNNEGTVWTKAKKCSASYDLFSVNGNYINLKGEIGKNFMYNMDIITFEIFCLLFLLQWEIVFFISVALSSKEHKFDLISSLKFG